MALPSKHVFMSEILSRHRQFCEFSLYYRRLSPRTIKSYEDTLKQYLKFSKIEDLSQFSRKSISNWIMYAQRELNWSPKSAHIRLGDLKAFAKWCVTEEILKSNPVTELQLPKLEHKEPEFFTEEETEKLMDWVRNYPYHEELERNRAVAVFATFIQAGLRREELLNLRLQDVKVTEGYIHVREAKGKKDRTVLFHPSLGYILERYLKDRKKLRATCPNFFVSIRNNVGLCDSVLTRLFEKIQSASKMKVYPHKLRHTFATHSLNRGVTEHELMRQMGHSSRMSLMTYTHVCNQSLRRKISANGFRV